MDGPHMLANACFLYPHHLLCHYIREITLETAFVKILMATVVISTILLMIDGRWAGGALTKRIPTHRTDKELTQRLRWQRWPRSCCEWRGGIPDYGVHARV